MMEVEGSLDDENRNLFAEDETEVEDERNNPDDYAVEVPSTQQGTQANEIANLDVSTTITKPKRVIKNPQPKLDSDRIMGPRGITALLDEFKDWKPRGNGHEFQDLEQVLSKLNHWTHRLYPKLPFDATLNIIENRLGNKKVVQCHVKKIRLDMIGPNQRQEETNDQDQPLVRDEQEEGEQEVERYGEESSNHHNSQDDDFNNLVPSNRQTTTTLTDEQLERMRRNKEMAAQKKREREAQKKREEEEIQQAERDFATQGDLAQARGDLEQQLDDEEELMREMEQNEREIEDTSTRLNTECMIDPHSTTTTDISRSEAPSAASEWPVTSQDQEKRADSTDHVENPRNYSAENALIESDEPTKQLEPEKEKYPTENLMNLDEIMEDMDEVMEEETRG